MGDWSDDEKTTSKKSAPNNDDWGTDEVEKTTTKSYNDRGSSGRGGRGGRGGSYGDRGDRDGNRGDRDGSRGDRDANRGGSYGDRGDRDGNRGDRDGEGRGGYKRDRGEGEGESRPKRENTDRNGEKNGDGEKKDEKPREIYVPPEPTEDEAVMYGSGISVGINFDQFDKIDVTISENGKEFKPVSSFKEAGIRDSLLANITKCGYTKPTPVQKYAIPIIKAKLDLMGCAQTGSGKTAAFILPILENIMEDNDSLPMGETICLIIAPTRELAIQIYEEARKFARGTWVQIALVYGGTASNHQSDRLGKGCHMLIATPGRLMDFVKQGKISFGSLKFLVLDEADRMLDMGFKGTIEEICAHPTIQKSTLQTLLFSATFPEDVQRIAATYLRDYIFFAVGIVGGASTDVAQEVIEVPKKGKRNKLGDILKEYIKSKEEDRILVFVETKKTADFLASYMSETKISSTSIHGDRLQREREEALRDFRSGKHKVLIATSVAARGLDIKGVTHVINYDLPKDIQEYVHRIGRTGRVGNRGKATSFYDAENTNDSAVASDLARILKDANQPVPEFLGEAGQDGGDNFGGQDIRQGVDAGKKQEDDDMW